MRVIFTSIVCCLFFNSSLLIGSDDESSAVAPFNPEKFMSEFLDKYKAEKEGEKYIELNYIIKQIVQKRQAAMFINLAPEDFKADNIGGGKVYSDNSNALEKLVDVAIIEAISQKIFVVASFYEKVERESLEGGELITLSDFWDIVRNGWSETVGQNLVKHKANGSFTVPKETGNLYGKIRSKNGLYRTSC